MSLRKTLSLITLFVVSMVILMLSSSYAWYSFNNASTTFETLTSNEDIRVIYKSSRFISTVTAVPISSKEIDKLSEKNNFSIDVDNDKVDEALSVSVSLIGIEIDNALKNSNFRYELLFNGSSVGNGNFSGLSSDKLTIVDDVILNNLGVNNFELRLYLLDDGSNQNNLMNKTFKAIINVNVISRVNVTLDNQDVDFLVKSIIVDGKQSSKIPNTGRYNMEASCDNGSVIKWDSLTKSIKISGGNDISDRCSLVFTSSDSSDKLSSIVKSGDYVKYSGNNGCVGSYCEGNNINFVDNTNMGYCNSFNYKYIANGYRVMYVEDDTAYIVSAGAVECVEGNGLYDLSLKYCNSNYVYNNTCNEDSIRVINDYDFKKIVNGDLSNCNGVKSNKSCGYNNDLIDNGGYYWISSLDSLFEWNPINRMVNKNSNNGYKGLRPVIRLNSNVIVISGNGTYSDPYVIGVK